MTLPERRWLNGPTTASSSMTDDSAMLAQTWARSPDLRVDELAAGADDAAGPHARRAAEDDVGLDRDVHGEVHGPVDVGRGRVAHRDPGPHVGLVEAHPQAPLGRRELVPVIDAVEAAVVLEADRGDDPAVLAGEPHEVGQVQLAGRGRRLERRDPPAQPGRVEGVQPDVDLVALELLGRRVLGLDDPLDGPEVAAHHAAERRRVGGVDAGERDGGPVGAARLDDGLEVGAGHQRDVARQHDDLGRGLGDRRQRGPDGISRPARLVLQREGRLAVEGLGDRGHGRRVDDDRRRAGGAVSGGRPRIEDVGEHRPAAHRVEDLGERGPHPRPEPGRHHDSDRP